MSIRTFVQEQGIPCSTAYMVCTGVRTKTVKILLGIPERHTKNIWNNKQG